MKTKQTVELEKLIYGHTMKIGVFGCFEVTIGWFGKGRVDYMTFDTKDIVRCYEIKSTKSDFNSKNGHNFVGDFNYYVMPYELYKLVKTEIPQNVGVYTSDGFQLSCAKKAKRNKGIDTNNLKLYMIRSLSREAEKVFKSENVDLLNRQKSRISKLERELSQIKEKYHTLTNKIYMQYGRDVYHELI